MCHCQNSVPLSSSGSKIATGAHALVVERAEERDMLFLEKVIPAVFWESDAVSLWEHGTEPIYSLVADRRLPFDLGWMLCIERLMLPRDGLYRSTDNDAMVASSSSEIAASVANSKLKYLGRLSDLRRP